MAVRLCPNNHRVSDDWASFCPQCGAQMVLPQLAPADPTAAQPAPAKAPRYGRTVVLLAIGGVLFVCVACWGMYELSGGDEAAATREATRTAVAFAAAETRAHLPTATPHPTAAPTATSAPTEVPSPMPPTEVPTPAATPTLTGHALTVADIEHNKDRMTSIQWDNYRREVVGQRVRWTGTVSNVSDKGNVYLEMGQDTFTSVYLEGLPRDLLIEMSKGQVLEFEATLNKLSTWFGLSIWLDDPVLY